MATALREALLDLMIDGDVLHIPGGSEHNRGWHSFYLELLSLCDCEFGEIPVPLILNGAVFSDTNEKFQRLLAQVEFASERGKEIDALRLLQFHLESGTWQFDVSELE